MKKLLAAAVLLLASCVQAPIIPQTPRESLVAVEFSYQAALQTVEQMVNLGQFNAAQSKQVAELISAGSSALDAADMAVKQGNANALSLVSAANVAVTNLIVYLQQTKDKANEHLGSSYRPFGFAYVGCRRA